MSRRNDRVNFNWTTPEPKEFTWQHVMVEVLMDIREELRLIRRVVDCENAKQIPNLLRDIRAKLPAKRTKGSKP